MVTSGGHNTVRNNPVPLVFSFSHFLTHWLGAPGFTNVSPSIELRGPGQRCLGGLITARSPVIVGVYDVEGSPGDLRPIFALG
jgi:hypothetical protein